MSEPNERVAMDIMGPFDPPTDSGSAYILVIGDYLTKWVDVFPMPKKRRRGALISSCASGYSV